jgi:hypothetical protein
MSDPNSITLTLDGKQFVVGKLNIGQMQDLTVAVFLPLSDDPQENQRRIFDRNLACILAALKKTHPDLTLDKLKEWGFTPKEMVAAADDILVFSGLATRSIKSGETQAGPSSSIGAVNGAGSSAASPPG